MLSEFLVEFTAGAIVSAKDTFEKKASDFFVLYYKARVAELMVPTKEECLVLGYIPASRTEEEASRIYELSAQEEVKFMKVTEPIERVRRLVGLAARLEAGTKILVPADQAQWLLP